jgi:hypothetical protein
MVLQFRCLSPFLGSLVGENPGLEPWSSKGVDGSPAGSRRGNWARVRAGGESPGHFLRLALKPSPVADIALPVLCHTCLVFSKTCSVDLKSGDCAAVKGRDEYWNNKRREKQMNCELEEDAAVSFDMVVGDRAHRIVGILAGQELPEDFTRRAVLLVETAHSVLKDFPVRRNRREALAQAVTAAGVYLNRFLPSYEWQMIGSEFKVENSRFALVFSRNNKVVIDEIKLGVGRGGEIRVRKQIDRYVELGSKKWGDKFIGVRMCSIHEAAKSRLYTPASHRSEIFETTHLFAGLEIR